MEGTTVLRRFNRTYTQRIGALDESFLGLGLPLASARLLFEVGSSGPVTVRALRARLGLDSGYVSRLLRGLEQRHLVAVTPDPDDRRRRVVSLTRAGDRKLATLDRRSEQLAAGLLDPLSERQRGRLAEALATADLLVRAATIAFEVVDPASNDAQTAMGHYFDELDRRFAGGFDPGPLTEDDLATMRPPGGTFVLARSDGEVVACGGVQPLGDGVGEIKRMWVHDAWRGAGLGARMLRRLEVDAAALGHSVIRLDTNAALTDAIALYERSGYRPIDRYNDNPYAERWFEKAARVR
ncbi:MAG: helix-turn-helix domain-containing GNAT family N-acetyltransferase [Nocardioides sp.]|nr:helix-turn-helix domain-containing GNAT family N-acetyltransferase [Nocardioides sp.]